MAVIAPGTLYLTFFHGIEVLQDLWHQNMRRQRRFSNKMQHEGMNPNKFIFVRVLNAFANLQALEEGKHVHKQMIQIGCESDVSIGTSIVDMYAKCGSMEDALRVFMKFTSCDVVSWTAILLGYVKCGQEQKALQLFQ